MTIQKTSKKTGFELPCKLPSKKTISLKCHKEKKKKKKKKNSAEVGVAPALGKVTDARNLGQGHRLMSVLGL